MQQADPRRALIALLPDLRGYARFLVRNMTEADDLVQEAVTRALAALPQFQAGTNLRAWTFTILRNTFFEQARRRRTEQVAIAQSFAPIESGGGEQDGHLALSELQKHLFALPALLREALVLVGAQGLSYEEAAVVCGVPVGTVKARVSRARVQLARAVGQTAGPAAPTAPA